MKIKKLLLFLFVIFCTQVFAQKTIYGKVLDEDEKPLIGATIYLNNTSTWTTSDDTGEFELPIKNGSFKMIVSYLGYYSLLHTITPDSYGKRLVFKMDPKVNQLNEVVVKTTKISKTRKNRYMQQFLDSFLGTSSLAKSCIILNKDVIHFKYNQGTKTLEATATEPLKIRNNGLGYLISYDLISFKKNAKGSSYLGYSRYENLEATKLTTKRWLKKRKSAYRGSLMHFLQSVVADDLKKEGFSVDIFKEVQNPKRPHDTIIQNAMISLENLVSPSGERFLVEKSKNSTDKKTNLYHAKSELDFIQKKNSYLNVLRKENLPESMRPHDSILQKARISLQNLVSPSGERHSEKGVRKKVKLYYAKSESDFNKKKKKYTAILNKANLPKTKNKYLKNVARKEFTVYKSGALNLSFKYYINVKYMREKEDRNYPYSGYNGPRRGHQLSRIELTVPYAQISSSGNIINPLQVVSYQHMAYEKLGDTLPLNYIIEN